MLAELKLGDRRLLAGERGERWLSGASTRAAADLAPEALISVQRGRAGYVFVGRSGTAYETDSPLGRFLRASSPDAPLANVVAARGSIVGIARDGALVQSSDAGAVWEAVGPADARFVDVALLDGGAGLALAVPEQLWRARGGARGWERLDAAPFGAVDLEIFGSRVVVSSTLGTWSWEPGSSALQRLPRRPTAERGAKLELGTTPPRGPDAAAILDGRAQLWADAYFELAKAENADGWELWSGPFHGELKKRDVPALKGCTAAKLAAFGGVLEVACTRDPLGETAQRIAFYRGTRGQKLLPEDFQAQGRFADLRMSLAREGRLVVSGICADGTLRGCKPRGVHYRRLEREEDARTRGRNRAEDQAQAPSAARSRRTERSPSEPGERRAKAARRRYELALAATPSLRGPAEALAVSPAGDRVYAVGPRAKSGTYALFVSRDGGRSFDARELSHGQSTPPVADEYWPERSYSGLAVEALGAGDDGNVAVVFRRYGELAVVTTDEDGRLLSVARPPADARLVGAVGTRALAIAGSSGESWESLDAGASWTALGRIGLVPCPSDNRCVVPMYCSVAGCVLGRELSRVGWGTSSEARAAEVMLPPATGQGGFFERRLREPIGCTLDEKPWAPLEGADRLPGAKQTAIGGVAWFLEAEDPARAASWVWHGERGDVERRELLRATGAAHGLALHTSLQVEGVAALRFSTSGALLGPIEVAWENLVERRVVTARLERAGTLLPSDYQVRSDGTRLARPALLSIAQDGIYVRPHRTSRDAQVTYFLDGRRTVELPPVPWPSAGGFTEMAHPDGVHVPFTITGSGATLTTARQQGAEWRFDAQTTGLVRPEAFALAQDWDLTYDEGRAGIAVLFWDRQGTYRRSHFYRLAGGDRTVLSPEPLPTLLDTNDRPRACSTIQRDKTPRVVVPFMAGTRHPVLISHASDPVRAFLTGAAVMHGTPGEPCVAAFEADPVPEPDAPEGTNERALIVLEDLEHAWLFRAVVTDSASPSIEYRRMSCRFDPGAEVPAPVYEQPGTKVRR